MKFLIDMNLSPQWVTVLEEEGWELGTEPIQVAYREGRPCQY